jgi:hypothetical protein
VPVELRFLKDRDAIADDFEPSLAGRYQLNIRFRVVISELSRQTGGSGLIVSNRAVFDGDLHCSAPYWVRKIAFRTLHCVN